MNNFRWLLLPFSIIYAVVTELRNWLYDKGLKKSETFPVPVINVGNLSMGGTGKTPQIEYLIRLLQNDYKIAVISRGYKRQTKGFVLADNNSTPESIGDEPYQIFKKFKNIIVAVSENRATGIRKVLDRFLPEVILLDDAFQHRRVKPGLNILLTPYQKPFYQDCILPTGKLREIKKNAKRADMVIVTKSPEVLRKNDIDNIINKIKTYTNADIFFSNIIYSQNIYGKNDIIKLDNITGYTVLLVTGIANPKPLYSFLSKKNINFESLKFGDHHNFSKSDIQLIKSRFNTIKSDNKIILTTEKDFVKLQAHFNRNLYYIPIETQIIEERKFNNKIIEYVKNKQ